MYGRGTYGRGMYGRGAYGRGSMYGGYGDGPMGAGPGAAIGAGGGWMDAIQRTLYGFGQFSQLLDGSYFSMHESFSSLMEFLHVIGELRHHLSFVLKVRCYYIGFCHFFF